MDKSDLITLLQCIEFVSSQLTRFSDLDNIIDFCSLDDLHQKIEAWIVSSDKDNN